MHVMIRFKGNMCLEAIIRCKGQVKSFWNIHFRWGLRVWSILDAGFLVSFRCRARRLEMFAWHPRFKVGVSRKLWMKLKTRCLVPDAWCAVSSSATKAFMTGVNQRCGMEALGWKLWRLWRIHLKCLHSAIVAFDPIGIYLWHTLAAELH